MVSVPSMSTSERFATPNRFLKAQRLTLLSNDEENTQKFTYERIGTKPFEARI
jgi:hypothetical protein